jgi:hypothetical protein
MKPFLPGFGLSLVCLLLGGTSAGVQAEEKSPVKLTIHPAAEPKPALKHQLLPGFAERIDGNAAVYYGKVTAEQMSFFSDRELADKIEKWRVAPLEDLRKDDVNLKLGTIAYYLDRAARCKYCDWQLPFRDEPFFEILLPDLQQTRQFARILGTKARIHIARGEYDQAVKTLQSGMAISQHVTAGETIINGLVGIAIAGIMCEQVTELVQRPDAPNLYWALTSLPRPLVDLRKGIEAEMSAVTLSYPDLKGVGEAEHSPEEWRRILLKFWGQFTRVMGDGGNAVQGPEVLVALSLRGYPMAKEDLVARGLPREKVEAMPVAQVVLLHTMQAYEELRDDIFKWYYVPYADGAAGIAEAQKRVDSQTGAWRETIPLASMLLPAVGNVRSSVVKLDRQIAVLRLIEALRIHGALHGGQLPGSLNDITAVPVPLDPATEEPFVYSLQNNTARLQGPELRGAALNYEITMVQK